VFGYEPLGYFTGDGWVKIYRKLEGGREGGREGKGKLSRHSGNYRLWNAL